MRYIFFCSNCSFTGSDEQYKMNNPSKCPECDNVLTFTGISQEKWRSSSQEEKSLLKNKWKEEADQKKEAILKKEAMQEEILSRRINHMLTSGYNFEGYKITSYRGIVSGEAVLGTGFVSEFSATISDLLGSASAEFGNKMRQAKEIATSKMIDSSVSKGSNAIIGVDFDYTTLGNNMIAVSANGTSVIIERIQE